MAEPGLGRLTVRCEALGVDGHELISQVAIGCHVPCDPDASPARIWSGLRARFAALTLIQQPLVIIIDHFDQIDVSCQQTVLPAAASTGGFDRFEADDHPCNDMSIVTIPAGPAGHSSICGLK